MVTSRYKFTRDIDRNGHWDGRTYVVTIRETGDRLGVVRRNDRTPSGYYGRWTAVVGHQEEGPWRGQAIRVGAGTREECARKLEQSTTQRRA